MGHWEFKPADRSVMKAILGGATVFGMSTDLKLKVVTDPTTTPPKVSTTRLSWATSLFYFGMLAGVVPLTYLFQRFHLGRTIGLAVIAWGAIAMSTAGVHDYKGLWAQRFFLGFAESIMPTAFMIIVSGYYTQAEQTWRQCIWYSATGGWTILGALINYGFAHITGGDLKKWQYLYLMAGALTVVYGALFLFFPNSPAQAWWFTEEEKRVAVERLRMSQTGVRCQKIKWSQFREACLDAKVWMIAIMMGAVSLPLTLHVQELFRLPSYLIQLLCVLMIQIGLHGEWRGVRVRPTHCVYVWLVSLRLIALADATRRSLSRWDSACGISQSQGVQPPFDHANRLLFARHRRMCNDLEKHLVRARSYSDRRIYDHRFLRSSDELDSIDGHVECGRQHEEVLHGCSYLCLLHCWKYLWTLLDQERNCRSTLSKVVGRYYRLLCLGDCPGYCAVCHVDDRKSKKESAQSGEKGGRESCIRRLDGQGELALQICVLIAKNSIRVAQRRCYNNRHLRKQSIWQTQG